MTPSGEVQVCLWMSRCGNVVLCQSENFKVFDFNFLTHICT